MKTEIETTQHTPSPWEVHQTGPLDNGFPGLTVQSDFGLIVRLPDENDDENKANAYLIAAAPEMLIACKSALRALRDNLHPGPMDGEAKTELERMIAKAERTS